MDINIATSRLGASAVICDTVLEQSVESDVTVPDYQPQILKIVKTIAEPVIMQRLAVGTRLTVEGFVKLTILYLSDERNGLHSIGQRLAFSKQLELKEDAGERSRVAADVRMSYINCRAINPRRLDVRGAVSLAVKVLAETESEYISGIEGDGAKTLTESISYAALSEHAEKQFTVDETLEIEPVDGMSGEIIRSGAEIIIENAAVSGASVEVTGTLLATVAASYFDDDKNEVRRYGFSIPFNQSIDLGRAPNEDAVISVEGEVASCSVQADSAEANLPEISVTCAISVKTFEGRQASLASDVFSTRYETVEAREAISFSESILNVNTEFEEKRTIENNSDAVLLDYFITSHKLELDAEDASRGALHKVSLSCVYSRGDDAECRDYTLEFATPLDLASSGAEPAAYLRAGIKRLECRQQGGQVSALISGTVRGTVDCQKRVTAIKEITFDHSKPKPRSPYALSVYFALAGEDVWDIAKRFNTDAESIMNDNALGETTLDGDKTLLIPIVG